MFCSECILSSIPFKFIGRNFYGQLGIGCGWTEQFGDDLPTLDFADGFIPEMMALGEYHSCFVSGNGSVVCFGRNQYGQVRAYCVAVHFWYSVRFLYPQLGYGDIENRGICNSSYEHIHDLPTVDLGAGFRVAQIMGLYRHNCALSTKQELKCWGKQKACL